MQFTMHLPQGVVFILQQLNQAGHFAYCVGGCVRDSLLGKEPLDWDITTSAHPEEIQKCFVGYSVMPTGLQHGTVTVQIQGANFEITTFRVDGEYADGRHPDGVLFTRSITEDLARRDFTINAIAYHPDEGLLDPFGGTDDLQSKLLRTVGEPAIRFSEDALRIWRGVRLVAQLGLTVEQHTEQAMNSCKGKLDNIARERIQVELTKTLLGAYSKRALDRFTELAVYTLPELAPMVGFPQKTPYHRYDVWEHTLHSIAQAVPVAEIRLAMLFHDSGKPHTHSVDEQGVAHFYGHPAISKKLAYEAMLRLRYSREEIKRVVMLVEYHDVVIAPTQKAVRRWLYHLGEQVFLDLLEVKKADARSQSQQYGEAHVKQVALVEDVYKTIRAEEQCFSLNQLAITGTDLLLLGVPQGTAVGALLKQAMEQVLEGTLANEHTALLEYAVQEWKRLPHEG